MINRSAVATVFLDGKHLVLLGPDTGELAREKTDQPVSKLAEAFTRHGYPWRADGDPQADAFRLWSSTSPGLPAGAGALLSIRARALKDDKTEDAADLRAELLNLGVVVRDQGGKQYWRPVGPNQLGGLTSAMAMIMANEDFEELVAVALDTIPAELAEPDRQLRGAGRGLPTARRAAGHPRSLHRRPADRAQRVLHRAAGHGADLPRAHPGHLRDPRGRGRGGPDHRGARDRPPLRHRRRRGCTSWATAEATRAKSRAPTAVRPTRPVIKSCGRASPIATLGVQGAV